jgi:hypothetical protein
MPTRGGTAEISFEELFRGDVYVPPVERPALNVCR